MAETEGEKKKGGFKRVLKIGALIAAAAAAVMFWKRRKGNDLDDVEWQELPPPAGG